MISKNSVQVPIGEPSEFSLPLHAVVRILLDESVRQIARAARLEPRPGVRPPRRASRASAGGVNAVAVPYAFDTSMAPSGSIACLDAPGPYRWARASACMWVGCPASRISCTRHAYGRGRRGSRARRVVRFSNSPCWRVGRWASIRPRARVAVYRAATMGEQLGHEKAIVARRRTSAWRPENI